MYTLAVFISLLAVSLAAEVCFPPCGCFNDNPPWAGRLLPVGWQQLQLHYNLYTRANRNNPRRIEVDSMVIPSEFDASRPTKFLIHGWIEADLDLFQETKDAMLDYQAMNVIIVHWDSTNIWYPQNAMDTRLVGACSARFAQELVREGGTQLGRIHCVGFSLGGQSCGFMGKASRDQYQGLLPRVTGLDPAGPEFDEADTRTHIARGDATFVDITHTNGHLLGMANPVGDVDFFPNSNAQPQPPCEFEEGTRDACDHMAARSYFKFSISARGQCQFTANPCTSIADANGGNCETCNAGSTCQRMGYFADTMPGRGSFFLRTVRQEPYCEN